MYDWLTAHKIPLGAWLKRFVDFLNEHAARLLRFHHPRPRLDHRRRSPTRSSGSRRSSSSRILGVGTWLLHRSIGLAVAVVLGLLLVINLGYWQATIETLSLVVCATLVCVVIGVPIGIAAAHRPWLYTAIRPILDLMQTIPTFVYLIPTLVLFGLGMVPGLISTVIFAIPAPIRLTHLGISSVPKPAARGRRGLRRHQAPAPLEGRAALRAADHHGRHHPVHHAVAVDGGDRRAGRRRRPRQAGGARAQLGQYRAWASRPGSPSSSSPSSSTASASGPSAAGKSMNARRSSSSDVDIVFGGDEKRALADDRPRRQPRRDHRRDPRRPRRDGDQPRRRARRDLRADGPLGLGQVDDSARRQRLNKVARGKVAGRARGPEGRRRRAAAPATLRELRTQHASPWSSSSSRCCPGGRCARMSASASSSAAWRTAERNAHRRREARLVGLSGWAEKYSHELSGGMQQRVGLARAFATDADILLMDEPFSALDPLIRDKLQDELLDLQKELKKTIVFVSHDLDEALKLGNSIAILEGGRIVQSADAEDILLTPGQRLRRRVRQAHEPAQRAPRHLGDDAGLDAPPRGRRAPHRRRAASASTSTPTTTRSARRSTAARPGSPPPTASPARSRSTSAT